MKRTKKMSLMAVGMMACLICAPSAFATTPVIPTNTVKTPTPVVKPVVNIPKPTPPIVRPTPSTVKPAFNGGRGQNGIGGLGRQNGSGGQSSILGGQNANSGRGQNGIGGLGRQNGSSGQSGILGGQNANSGRGQNGIGGFGRQNGNNSGQGITSGGGQQNKTSFQTFGTGDQSNKGSQGRSIVDTWRHNQTGDTAVMPPPNTGKTFQPTATSGGGGFVRPTSHADKTPSPAISGTGGKGYKGNQGNQGGYGSTTAMPTTHTGKTYHPIETSNTGGFVRPHHNGDHPRRNQTGGTTDNSALATDNSVAAAVPAAATDPNDTIQTITSVANAATSVATAVTTLASALPPETSVRPASGSYTRQARAGSGFGSTHAAVVSGPPPNIVNSGPAAVTVSDRYALPAGQRGTFGASFNGDDVQEVTVQASGTGLSAGVDTDWSQNPCTANISVNADSGFAGGSVTLLLLNKNHDVIQRQTIEVPAGQ